MAELFQIPSMLLVALCSAESDFRSVINPMDGGSASIGVCQIKYSTARMLGFQGTPSTLLNSTVNAFYAAKYLRKQLDRYDGNICKAVPAYNLGMYRESFDGKPVNQKYLKRVLSRWKKFDKAKEGFCGRKKN